MKEFMNRCAEKTEIPVEIAQYLGEGDLFQQVMRLQGKAFRDVRGRKTIQVKLGDNSYFIKQHFGVGWAEIFKNLLTLRLPILGAKTEKLAIEKLNAIGIATTPLVGFGTQGCNPAKVQSFLITQDLGDIVSLEDLCVNWKINPPIAQFKRRLIIAVAKLARNLHEHGLNHRDFYLCHFCLDNTALPEVKLYLIDLHRVLVHAKPSLSANVKDIAALYFSSLDVGLTLRDYLRFKRHYQMQDAQFWHQVEARAQRLYVKFRSAKFQGRLSKEKSLIQS